MEDLPSQCYIYIFFFFDHARKWKKVGFMSICYDKVRDVRAKLPYYMRQDSTLRLNESRLVDREPSPSGYSSDLNITDN